MPNAQVCFDEMRDARRQYEHAILTVILPDVLCRVISDYAQFDDQLISRIKNLKVSTLDVWVASLLTYTTTDDSEYITIATENNSGRRIALASPMYSCVDILGSCFGGQNMFVYKMIQTITTVSNGSRDTNGAREFVEREIIDAIRWPKKM